MKNLIFLALFLAIGLIGKVSTKNGDQACHPVDNITNLKNLRKPTLDFKADFWPFVTTPISNKLFGRPKMPELGTKVINLGSDTFGNPIFQTVLQN